MNKDAICRNCNGKGYNVIITGDRNDYCGVSNRLCPDCNGRGIIQVPMTNADRIRAMSDEKLAEFLLNSCDESKCEDAPQTEMGSACCRICRLNWLRQPVKDGAT